MITNDYKWLQMYTYCNCLKWYELNVFKNNQVHVNVTLLYTFTLPSRSSRWPSPPCRCAWRWQLHRRRSASTLGSSNRSCSSCGLLESTAALGSKLCRKKGPRLRPFDSLPGTWHHVASRDIDVASRGMRFVKVQRNQGRAKWRQLRKI